MAKTRRNRPEPIGREADLPTSAANGANWLARLSVDSCTMLAYRLLVVAMQAATILITWQLWQLRDDPPLLPALNVPQFDMGYLLLASLAVVLAAPRLGLALHAALLIWSMLQDQFRMQPELISMWLLMLGTLSHPAAKLIARVHLVTIWFYAAFHKLICAEYYFHEVPPQFTGLFGENDPWPTIFDMLRGGVALFEMSLAVLALIPRTRKWCAWQAAIFHIGVLQYLMFWLDPGEDRFGWNEAVWPWNIALIPAGFALIRTWPSTAWHDLRVRPLWARAVVALLCIYPAGYYVGLVDAYLAHCLYSINTPAAAILTYGGDEPEQIYELRALHIPFPPVPRLYEAYFDKIAQPGDTLIIKDRRRYARGLPGWKVVDGVAVRRITKR
jgi:hypothetical protein